jgi:hypothetical protein
VAILLMKYRYILMPSFYPTNSTALNHRISDNN